MAVIGLIVSRVMRMVCCLVVNMLGRMLMTLIVLMAGIRLMVFGIMGVAVTGFALLVVVMLLIVRLRGLRRICVFRLNDLALYPLAIAAAAGVAMPRTAV